MKKAAILIASVALFLVAVPAFAAKHGPAGKSNIAHLYLYEKNPSDWKIVSGGAWGKMTYNQSGPTFDYVFNGHGLQSNKSYSLIYYGDPWPGNNPGALIASGVSNSDGNIHLGGSIDLGMDLPAPADANYPIGAKIWLVTSADYDAGSTKMIAWNPTQYLFEHNLITFDDTP